MPTVVVAFVLWLASMYLFVALVVADVARERGFSAGKFFLLSILATPVVGFAILALLDLRRPHDDHPLRGHPPPPLRWPSAPPRA